MALQPTAEQLSAIETRGNLLISAAAGSGKTAVLVERVIAMLTDRTAPVSADRLLIVTFTNLAAAEMRGRIEKRLSEECQKYPDDPALMRQRHLIATAKICTIDSFCIDLIRENFERAGVSPDFRISDDDGMRVMCKAVLSDIVGEYLANEDPVFRDLLDITGSEYDEENLLEAVFRIFAYSNQTPFPQVFLERLALPYTTPFKAGHPWYDYAIGRVGTFCTEAREPLAAARELAAGTPNGEKYFPLLDYLSEEISALAAAADDTWDVVYGRLAGFVRPGLPSVRGGAAVAGLTSVKETISFLCDEIASLKGLIFADRSTVEANNARLRAPILLLLQIVADYGERLFERQKRENTLTFYNTEQLALSMLCEYRDGAAVMRNDAAEFIERFDEILVDEYQDVNDLQNMLFSILSDRERKLFAVGDVKQSIYGFRGANPEHFLRKKKNALPVEQAGEGAAKGIVLSANFRSRKEICDYINFFFSLMMTEQTGGIVYREGEQLKAQAKFPSAAEPCVELHAIDEISAGKDGEGENSLTAEARYIAAYIRRVMASGACIRADENTLRPARYSDFAILLRATKNKAPVMAAELRRQGIPIQYSSESFLQTVEVATFLSLLQVLDNPKSDIELLTVMMSPIFGFSAEQMAVIRAHSGSGDLISAVSAAAERGDRCCADFLGRLNELRSVAVMMPLPRFISHLLVSTDYMNIVSSMNDGARRRGNLQLLAGYASKYCETASGGIGGFIRYLQRLPEGNLASAKAGGGAEAVRIMSMHASKGLQFPICIIANTASQLNRQDSSERMLFSETLGLGFRYYEEQLNEKVTSAGHAAIADAARRRSLEEELRLLYVAMTRAEDKLVLISSNRNLRKKVGTLAARLLTSGGKIRRALFSSVSSINDWLLMTALLHPDGGPLRQLGGVALLPNEAAGRFSVSVASGSDIPDITAPQKDTAAVEPDPALVDRIRENISYRYPYDALREIEAKVSVSRLTNRAESERFAFSEKPAFMLRDGLTAAARGTATHKVMQFIRMENMPDIEAELTRLTEWQFITENEAAAVDRAALRHFFESDIYRRILHASKVHREMRFLTELPATVVNPSLKEDLHGETVVVQGAVDLCFTEEDGVVVLDFKTDRVDDPKVLSAAYSEQLAIYAKACEKIFGLPVKQRIIYSFALMREIVL